MPKQELGYSRSSPSSPLITDLTLVKVLAVHTLALASFSALSATQQNAAGDRVVSYELIKDDAILTVTCKGTRCQYKSGRKGSRQKKLRKHADILRAINSR
jgi:hypothetical protein